MNTQEHHKHKGAIQQDLRNYMTSGIKSSNPSSSSSEYDPRAQLSTAVVREIDYYRSLPFTRYALIDIADF